MIFTELALPGLYLIETEPFVDHRGAFSRLFCEKELKDIGMEKAIVQVNYSQTRTKGTVRGMHMQHAPNAEIKIVRCMKGACFDVAVDMRPESPTYLKWYGEILTPDNGKALMVPEGFAHGFQALEDNSDLMYFVTEFYAPESEGGLRFNDPAVGIEWPLEPVNVSEKDLQQPLL